MDRRTFIVAALALLIAPIALDAFAAEPRIGILADTPGPHWQIFRRGLKQSGYVEGKTIALEWRWAEGQAKRFPDLAAELVRMKVDVIVAEGTPAIRAAKGATSTIPIVMAIAADPVGAGFVQSLTRPGGNITGSSSRSPELYLKQMQLLQEVVPGLTRVAVLWHPGNRPVLKELEAAAGLLRLQLQLIEARDPGEVRAAFTALRAQRPQALLVMATPTFDGLQAELAQHAADARLATVYNKTVFAQSGGLFSYGARYSDFFRRAAEYVDKILKGAKPDELPVEQATSFELVVNAKAAKALGISIPLPLRVRADQVIE